MRLMTTDIVKVEILVVTNSLSGGGAERASNVLVNALHNLGVNVALVAINSGPSDFVALNCLFFELNRPWPGSIFSTIKAWFKMQVLINKIKPTFLVLNCDLPEFICSLLFFQGQIVVVEHAARPWPTRVFIGKGVRWLLRQRKAKWVAVSNHLSIWPNNTTPDVAINNPVIPNAMHTLDTSTEPNSARIIHIGRLIDSKQPDWVLELAHRLNRQCVFIGSGKMELQMKELALNKSINAVFAGFTKDPWSLVKNGDLVVITSREEGDGLVLVEAILHNIAFLAHNIADFEKFNLPPNSICSSIDDFEVKARKFFQGDLKLELSQDFKLDILKLRDPKLIGNQWIRFLFGNAD